jgi:ankyrin repeat protein
VDVNAKCADGDLAVHYASAQGEKKCIELLAKAGSELETKDNDGETPMQVSHVRVREILAELIVAARRAKTAC